MESGVILNFFVVGSVATGGDDSPWANGLVIEPVAFHWPRSFSQSCVDAGGFGVALLCFGVARPLPFPEALSGSGVFLGFFLVGVAAGDDEAALVAGGFGMAVLCFWVVSVGGSAPPSRDILVVVGLPL